MNRQSGVGRVLVIEDDSSTQILVAEVLRPLGLVVSPVSDGRDAVPKVLELQPDIVVLDIALPGRSGWDVLAELRTLDETRTLPIVVITAQGQPSWAAEARRCGANEFIEKPFRIGALAEAVTRLIPEAIAPEGAAPDA